MKEIIQKIIIPYFIISIFFLIFYSFSYWFVDKFFEINDDYIAFFGPAIISGLIVWFIIRRKVKQLKINARYELFLCFSSWALLAAPVFASNYYIHRANGEITYLENPDEINNEPKTLYYSIKKSKIDKDNFHVSFQQSSANRGREIAVSVYFVCPLLSENEHEEKKSKTWIGKQIGEKFSNRVLDNKEKQRNLIDDFIDSSFYEFQSHQFQTKFLKRTSFDLENDFKESLKNVLPTQYIIILIEESGTYETRTKSSFSWMIAFLIASNLIWILSTIFQKLKR